MTGWVHGLDWRNYATTGAGVLVALGLLALVALLVRGRPVRLPAALFGLYLAVSGVLLLLPDRPGGRPILEGLQVFFLFGSIARSSFLLVVDGFVGQRLGKPLPKIFHQILQTLVILVVALGSLHTMGAELGSLLTTSAILTAVIGLALQETLSNLAAGVAIQMQRPFKVGDFIQYDPDPNLIGQILEINWRATKVITNDRIELIVPNAMLAKAAVRNYSAPAPVTRRVLTLLGPYHEPPHRIEAALLEAASGVPGVLTDPAPEVAVRAYQDSGIEYALLYFIEDFGRRLQIDSGIRRRVWYVCQRARISLPYPVRDVYVHEAPGASREASDRAALLSTVDLFAVLPEPARARLAEGADLRWYGAGETVIRQGDVGTDLYVLQSGRVAVLVEHPGRGPVTVAQLGQGEVFGEMSLLTGEARSATVRAEADAELLVIGHVALREILSSVPELATLLARVLARRQGELDRAMAQPGAVEGESPMVGNSQLVGRIREFLKL
jgi:small-conductance mechanosensitive channel/CRP-like cAMP-binding protein